MTRINCIPPEELCRQHLVAEYRELPRVVALAERAWAARGEAALRDAPLNYTLGAGHVRFFYAKQAWAAERFAALVAEMQRRGYRTAHCALPACNVPAHWRGAWIPTPADQALNRARIAERLAAMRTQQSSSPNHPEHPK